MFDRFRQADQSTTREHGGLGLGLAIAKEIAELHGGTLKVTSQGRGRGASFTLTLPRLQGVMPRLEAAAGPRPDLRGTRVLVVDDDPESLEIAAKALESAGAATALARSGPEALAKWGDEEFDVLICDLAMPGMDGYEVLRQIRQLPNAGRGRAIALTALASDSDRDKVIAAGFDDHVVKPFNFPDLLRAVSPAA